MYRPMLRWKRGEQTALAKIADEDKGVVWPVLTIAGHAYDPLGGDGVDPAFDARIAQDAARLRDAWTGHKVAVDLSAVDPEAKCDGHLHPIKSFFGALDGAVDARPVLRPRGDSRLVEAVAGLGVPPTFRLTPDDLGLPDTEKVLRGHLAACRVAPGDCDAVVDLGHGATAGRTLITARGALSILPFMEEWASVTLAAGSFPENLAQFSPGAHVVRRIEWDVWRAVDAAIPDQILYGDYATLHPLPVEEALDPRTMNPSASVRYTREDTWLVLRGEGTRNPRGRGFAQFRDHAETLVRRPEYRGEAFSFGDARIARIARGEEKPGNFETWVTIGVNHHIAEVVGQLATLSST